MESQVSSAAETSWLRPHLVKEFILINPLKWIFLPWFSKSPENLREDVFPLESHPSKLAWLPLWCQHKRKNPASGWVHTRPTTSVTMQPASDSSSTCEWFMHMSQLGASLPPPPLELSPTIPYHIQSYQHPAPHPTSSSPRFSGCRGAKAWRWPPQSLSARVTDAKRQRGKVSRTRVLQSGRSWVKFKFLQLLVAWP